MEKDYIQLIQVKIDSKLNRKSHVNAIAKKLNSANTMLYKVRDFVDANILKTIYYELLNHTLTMLASFGDKILA